MQSHPFKITNWGNWSRMFARLSPDEKRGAAKLGVEEQYVMGRLAGQRSDAVTTALHERFVAACVLGELVSEREVGEVLQKWATPDGLATKGALLPFPVSRGTYLIVLRRPSDFLHHLTRYGTRVYREMMWPACVHRHLSFG